MKRIKIRYIVLLLVLVNLIVFLVLSPTLLEDYKQAKTNEELTKTAVQDNDPTKKINFDELTKKNPDTVGWLYISNTKISQPVVKSHDNKEYIHKSFTGETTDMGTLFLDKDAELVSANFVIYGHNLGLPGVMLSDLRKVLDGDIPLDTINPIYFQMINGINAEFTPIAVIKVNKTDKRVRKFDYESYDEQKEILKSLIDDSYIKTDDAYQRLKHVTQSLMLVSCFVEQEGTPERIILISVRGK